MNQLILASQSPRRRDLLSEAGYKVRVDSVKLSEIIDKNLNPRAMAEKLAQDKGRAYVEQRKLLKNKGILVLSADTVVDFGGGILGKPRNRAEAAQFLIQLDGKMHSVITAICVQDLDADQEIVASAETKVWFRNLSKAEITEYVDGDEPYDKAGGYGIQGEAKKFVKKIEGSYSNVVGFPLELFSELEVKHGWKIRG